MLDRACGISIVFSALLFGLPHQAFACGEIPDPRFTCFDLPVSLSGGRLVAEAVVPVKRTPRAVVIVLPGTGGLSDPYFDAELQQKNYDPQHRGGLTAALTRAGYAVVFYNQRGYKRLGHCVTGRDFRQRARAFVFNCIDPVQRSSVDLKTITSDTQQVFDAVSNDARLRGLPHIPLAFSEGFYHLATLVSEGRYQPAGIVTVGGPQDSLSATFAYQFRREFYVDLAQRAFAKCPNPVQLTVDEALRCAGFPVHPQLRDGLGALFGNMSIDRSRLEAQAQWHRELQRAAFETYVTVKPDATLSGNFGGIPIPIGWSAAYYSQVFSDTVRVDEKLSRFAGRVVYLYGGFDDLVRIPNVLTPSPSASHCARYDCRIRVLKGKGHGLENTDGSIDQISLSSMVKAIDDVLVGRKLDPQGR